MRPPLVKICCIANLDEARRAVAHGAAAVGLVSSMPNGPGVIPEPVIAEIAAAMPPTVASFLLTSRQSATLIIDEQRRLRATAIQLCDRLAPGEYARLRAALPGVTLVQVIHVTGEDAVGVAREFAPRVDALLLDSGNPSAPLKELGATGRPHDWGISRRIRDGVDVPVYLAGGLRPDNVEEAIERVRPHGLDVCNGVRTGDRLDDAKLAAFFAAVRRAA